MTFPAIANGRQIRPVAAVLFMLGACACFAFNSVFVRLAAEQGTHPFVVAFFRNLFSPAFPMCGCLRLCKWFLNGSSV